MPKREALGELVELNPPLFRKTPPEELVSVVPMRSVDAATNMIEFSEQTPFAQVRKGLRPFVAGDVLFAKITPSMENGKGAVVREMPTRIGFGLTEFHVLRTKGDVLPEYVYYFLDQQRLRATARRHMTGTAGQLRVPASWLSQILLPVPNIDIQRKIVQELEAQFTKLASPEFRSLKAHGGPSASKSPGRERGGLP